jgi:tRNA pseudouridine55 synthase
MKDGILVVYKPAGITSHDVVECIRDILHTRQVGHAGTLDPLATGVLVVLVGRATKWFGRFLALEKEYNATLTLGKITDTQDAQGKTLEVCSVPAIEEDFVQNVFKGFLGEIQQIPPMVSALRFRGKRLYQLHAKGIEVPRQPRKIIIKDLQLLKLRSPEIEFYVKCSRGTYVRQLAYDIALRLGSGGYISKIERLSVGPFNIKEAIPIDKVNESCIQQWKD